MDKKRKIVPLHKTKNIFNHDSKLPDVFRMVVVGKSGSGKSVLTSQMLLEPNFFDYNRLYIYSSMIEKQPELKNICYAFNRNLNKETILKMFDNEVDEDAFSDYVDEIDKKLNLPQQVKAEYASSIDNMKDENEFDETKKNLVIFDDFLTDDLINDLAESLYIKARKSNVNLIYIGQRFKSIPKLVRANVNFVISFVQSKSDADLFYSEILSRIMDRKDFIKLTRKVWNNKKGNYNYMAVNLDTDAIYTDIFNDDENIESEN